MHRLVATRRPASALLQAQRVVRSANEQLAAADLLKVASQAEVRIANLEHLGIDRAVRRVAGRAALAQGLVLEHERSALGGMAAKAEFVLREQRGASARKMEPLCGEWQAVQLSRPSGTGWWEGRSNCPRTLGWHWKQTVSVERAGWSAGCAPKLLACGRPAVKL